jgi:hypothetical protein
MRELNLFLRIWAIVTRKTYLLSRSADRHDGVYATVLYISVSSLSLKVPCTAQYSTSHRHHILISHLSHLNLPKPVRFANSCARLLRATIGSIQPGAYFFLFSILSRVVNYIIAAGRETGVE